MVQQAEIEAHVKRAVQDGFKKTIRKQELKLLPWALNVFETKHKPSRKRERDDDDELELREEEGSRSIIRAKLGSSLGPWKRRMKPTGTPHASRRRCFTSIAEHHARTRSR